MKLERRRRRGCIKWEKTVNYFGIIRERDVIKLRTEGQALKTEMRLKDARGREGTWPSWNGLINWWSAFDDGCLV